MRVRKVSKTNILQENYFNSNGLVDTNVLVDLLFNKNKFNSEILIISAFFSDEVVEKFLSVNKNTKTKFFFRLKPRDFIDKSASFKGLELLIAENKEVFLTQDFTVSYICLITLYSFQGVLTLPKRD